MRPIVFKQQLKFAELVRKREKKLKREISKNRWKIKFQGEYWLSHDARIIYLMVIHRRCSFWRGSASVKKLLDEGRPDFIIRSIRVASRRGSVRRWIVKTLFLVVWTSLDHDWIHGCCKPPYPSSQTEPALHQIPRVIFSQSVPDRSCFPNE